MYLHVCMLLSENRSLKAWGCWHHSGRNPLIDLVATTGWGEEVSAQGCRAVM